MPFIDDIAVPSAGCGVVGNVYYKYNFISYDLPVVVSFAFLNSNAKKDDLKNEGFEPWAYHYLSKKGVNVVSFCCFEGNDWYLDDEFYEFTLWLGSVISEFPSRVGYGSSMGAFGVASHANNLRLDSILLCAPISTLNNELASFEYRFNPAVRRLDWSDKKKDGATCRSNGYVVYDPLFEVDSLHASRFSSLRPLKLLGVGHGIAVHLNNLGMLNWMVDELIWNGSISEDRFYEESRARKNYNRYYHWMLSNNNKYLTPGRSEVIRAYYERLLLKRGDAKVIENKYISQIRNIALSLEGENIQAAHDLMIIASKLRPEGPLINKKLKEMQIRLSEEKTKMGNH